MLRVLIERGALTGSCLTERARLGKFGECSAGIVKRRGFTAGEDFQLGGRSCLLSEDRLTVVGVDGLALGQEISQHVTLRQQLVANSRLAVSYTHLTLPTNREV